MDELNKKIEDLFKTVDIPAEKKPKTDTKILNDYKEFKVDKTPEEKYKDLMDSALSYQPSGSKKSKWGDLKNGLS